MLVRREPFIYRVSQRFNFTGSFSEQSGVNFLSENVGALIVSERYNRSKKPDFSQTELRTTKWEDKIISFQHFKQTSTVVYFKLQIQQHAMLNISKSSGIMTSLDVLDEERLSPELLREPPSKIKVARDSLYVACQFFPL